MSSERPHLLIGPPRLDPSFQSRLERDHARFAEQGLPNDFLGYLQSEYRINVAGRYAGKPIRSPFGKASGQLSMRLSQVEEDARAVLGFVVLKTVIAQDNAGDSSMGAWAIHAPRMVVEPIQGRDSGATGWTVTWRGRGWSESFESYLDLVRAATEVGRAHQMAVIPSVKYHLPGPGETTWRVSEYETTTRALIEACGDESPAIEKDFSPTLAGSDRASHRARILDWLETVPQLMREAADGKALLVGLKLFNAVDDNAFQVEMLEAVHRQQSRPDFLVYANRLFDPGREFDGVRGVAYGGPDLSDRNLRVLSSFRQRQTDSRSIEISATGDIASGRMAAEYLCRGCTSFQIHTGFQLPPSHYPMKIGSKVERALHQLYLDPTEGLLAWLHHLGRGLGLERDGVLHLLDLADHPNG